MTQHPVTHFEKETSILLYEYAQIFGSSVEEGVKRVTPWSAYCYTYPDSFYFVKPSAAGQLVCGEASKPVGERTSRNDEADMRFWAKRFGKHVRQYSVQAQAGTQPLNLYQ